MDDGNKINSNEFFLIRYNQKNLKFNEESWC